MERVRIKQRKHKFEYRARDPAALLRRIGRADRPQKETATRKRSALVYVTREERDRQRGMRNRKKLGIKHDLAVPADKLFTDGLAGLSDASRKNDALRLYGWRLNFARYLSWSCAKQKARGD